MVNFILINLAELRGTQSYIEIITKLKQSCPQWVELATFRLQVRNNIFFITFKFAIGNPIKIFPDARCVIILFTN